MSALNPESELNERLTKGMRHPPNLVIYVSEALVAMTPDPLKIDPDIKEVEAIMIHIHSDRGVAVGICPINRDNPMAPRALPQQLRILGPKSLGSINQPDEGVFEDNYVESDARADATSLIQRAARRH